MSVAATQPADDKRKRLWRLWNPATRQYLHLSGLGEVKGTTYAWSGKIRQIEALEAHAAKRGEPWPYVPHKLLGGPPA